MSKELIICADDYAQNEAISEGILSLLTKQRINAVSCLVNVPGWSELHQDLNPIIGSAFVGLHLNLTFGQPLSSKWRKHVGEHFTGLPQLLKKAYLGQLDAEVILAEIQAQIDVFTHTLHVYPDFIDGHEHIHQLPVIRKVLCDLYVKQHKLSQGSASQLADEEDFSDSTCFVRQTCNGWRDLLSVANFPKRQLITMLGGARLKRLLIREAISTNSSFSGIYNFSNALNYRKHFKQFLKKSKQGGLIMCHPGMISNDKDDPLNRYRHHELDYFLGDAFLSDLEDNSFQLMKKVS